MGLQRTLKNSTVSCQETIFQGKLKIAFPESFLRGDDAMNIVTCEKSDFFTAMSVEDAEERHSFVCIRLGLYVSFQVEDGGMGIFHADAPALHGGDAVDDAVIATFGGSLEEEGKRN